MYTHTLSESMVLDLFVRLGDSSSYHGLMTRLSQITEPEAEVVDSESIHSGNVLVHSQSTPGLWPCQRGSPFSLGNVHLMEIAVVVL